MAIGFSADGVTELIAKVLAQFTVPLGSCAREEGVSNVRRVGKCCCSLKLGTLFLGHFFPFFCLAFGFRGCAFFRQFVLCCVGDSFMAVCCEFCVN